MNNVDFKKLVEPYEEEMLQTLKELVAIPSVYDENTASEDAPYGAEAKKAVLYMQKLAESKGFKTEIVGNRCVEITYGDKGTEVGIFGHLDVVPLGTGWIHDPLGCEVENGIMYGRGVSDDKGPVVASFYAALALKENHLLDNFRLRMVLGSDEERGSSCLKYYFEEAKKPAVDTGFTPDAEYPLIYAEKGITNYELKGNINLGDDIISISAGVASNVVISEATIEVNNVEGFAQFLAHQDVKYKVDGNKVTFLGKSAHGSTPELGINAGVIMLKYAGEYYNSEVLKLLAKQYEDYNGRGLRHCIEKPALGKTTYNVGIISYENYSFNMVVNFRFPEDVDGEKVISEIQDISPLPIYYGEVLKVLYFDPNSKLVSTLMDVYQDETGDLESKPLAIGGGTYAKEAKNIVAFGPTFVGRNYKMHEADEEIPVQDLKDNLRIYAHAIYALGNK